MPRTKNMVFSETQPRKSSSQSELELIHTYRSAQEYYWIKPSYGTYAHNSTKINTKDVRVDFKLIKQAAFKKRYLSEASNAYRSLSSA
ncbi:hypothetical protein Leryth_015517 [Lithospermum erythrorhizon]|nr:hypothetical protein Leryth_015517 [Lithospermum erythrorhizon]